MKDKGKIDQETRVFHGPFHSDIIIDDSVQDLFSKQGKNCAEMGECKTSNTNCGLVIKPCRGTMNHSDTGGNIYNHVNLHCAICISNQCDFTDKQWESAGGY